MQSLTSLFERLCLEACLDSLVAGSLWSLYKTKIWIFAPFMPPCLYRCATAALNKTFV